MAETSVPPPYDAHQHRQMHAIVLGRHIQRLRGLVLGGASLNGSALYDPPLRQAVSHGWADGVQVLLAAGVDVHAQVHPHQGSPLSRLMETTASVTLIDAFTRSHVNPTLPDPDGHGPLDVLAQRTNLTQANRIKLDQALIRSFTAHLAREQAELRATLNDLPRARTAARARL